MLSWQQSGIYRDNITYYSHIIAVNPKARFAHSSLGDEYMKQGRYEEALALYQTDYRLIRAQPSLQLAFINTHLKMGRAYDNLGRHDQAEEHLVSAVELDPRHWPSLENLGLFRFDQKQYRQALDLFEALIRLKPGTARFYVNKGFALAGLNRIEEALQQFDRALSIDPSLEIARNNRAILLKFMQGR